MAKKELTNLIINLFSKLGGNMNNVLGSRSNITFLGKGKSPEGFIDSDINIDAIGVLGKNKILEELESSVGYLTADKLNDVQAGKLYENMLKVDEVFNPKQIPNITDLGTGIRNLDQEGIASLRAEQKLADDVVKDVSDMEFDIRSQFPKASEDEIRALVNRVESEVPKRPANYDELSMDDRRLNDIEAENIYRQILKEGKAGNRQMTPDELEDFVDEIGGADRLEAYTFDGTIKDAQRILAEDKAFTDEMFAQYKAGKLDPQPGERGRKEFLQKKLDEMEASGDKRLMTRDEIEELSGLETISNLRGTPTKRATAREFLVEALKEDDVAKGGNNFSDFITKEDLKYITEGGGGVAGDPLILVEKYFGPRIKELVPEGASSEEIAIFTKRVLNNVVDAAGNRPDSPRFDRFTARFIDEVQDFAKGGLAKILEV